MEQWTCYRDNRGCRHAHDCPKSEHCEIAVPQKGVENGHLVELRQWFCYRCGARWETRELLGAVDSIETRISARQSKTVG